MIGDEHGTFACDGTRKLVSDTKEGQEPESQSEMSRYSVNSVQCQPEDVPQPIHKRCTNVQ